MVFLAALLLAQTTYARFFLTLKHRRDYNLNAISMIIHVMFVIKTHTFRITCNTLFWP